jgi:hypothetical protein
MNIRAFLRVAVAVVGMFWAAGAAADPPAASVDAPATAAAGSKLSVKWTGPAGGPGVIGIIPAGSPDHKYPAVYNAYPKFRNPVRVTVPEQAGDYEVRYYANKQTIARSKLTVLPVTASLEAPSSAVGGKKISIRWIGPNNDGDTIVIVPASSTDREWLKGSTNDYTFKRSSMRLTAPERAGDYEVRYCTAGRKVLARSRLTVTSGIGASLSAPASVAAGARVKITWTGPKGEYDRIMISAKGSPDRKSVKNDFTFKGSPLGLTAPTEPGEYEIRYLTGQLFNVLARAPLTVTPAIEEPGAIRVTAAAGGASAAPGSVEVILDVSGSMLQKLGTERRIDIAKRTLATLTSDTIPAGTPFALRVLGRGANSCQSDLEIPFGPLDRTAAAAKIASLEAKSNAKTPIGAALEKIATDLAAAKGERLVILVTDGEETCGGNPAQTLQKLRKSGVNVRVNIVGFAVDDPQLAATFELWSDDGGGSYFDARDAKGLSDAFAQVVKPAFEISDAQKNVVAKGLVGSAAVRLLPGSYTVALKGPKPESRSVSVRARQTSSVSF